MQMNKLIRPAVGADVSRPAPIDRPRWLFQYPVLLLAMIAPHGEGWGKLLYVPIFAILPW
jgi:hypothetical protein